MESGGEQGTSIPLSSARLHESGLLRDHCDRTTGTLSSTDATALTEIVIELIFLQLTELDHRIVRAYAEAVVAPEAVAA